MKAIKGKSLVRVDINKKNWHTFESGLRIEIRRGYNNFDQREVRPVQGICEDSEKIPKGSEVLVHHNATHDTYKVFNEKKLGEENDIVLFSVPDNFIYAYREEGSKEWMPLEGFMIVKRVFQPTVMDAKIYIPTQVLKNRLYVSRGTFEGLCINTAIACDYEIVFQGTNDQEQRLIRMRDTSNLEYNECLGVDYEYTEKINKGELLVGLTADTATKLNG